MQWVAFYCHKKPLVLTSPDVRAHNLEALDSIGPTYFENIAKLIYTHFEVDAEDDLHTELEFSGDDASLKDHLASLARGTLFQACELVVMLTGALLQAPGAPVAYLNQLTPNGLRGVAETLKRGSVIPNVHNTEIIDAAVLNTIMARSGWPTDEDGGKIDIEQNVRLILFASDWVISTDYRAEYNHFKHGLRARSGGTHLRMAPQDASGTLPENPAWLSMGGPFGSHATEYEDVGCAAGGKIKSLWPNRVSRTWSLRSTLEAIELCSAVARNLLSCLKIVNGLSGEKAPFVFPADKEAYGRHTSRVTSLSKLSFKNTPPSPDQFQIHLDDILESLDRAYATPSAATE